MISKMLKVCVLAVLLTACSPKDNKLSELTINTENGPVTYQVETAATKEEMSRGLMNRQQLAADSGMIFDLQGQQQIAMWMKDTLIPLDMLFVNQNGKIIWIFENAVPMSTTLIKPQVNEPMSAVIELNGGDVAKNQIKIGDTVKHQIIK